MYSCSKCKTILGSDGICPNCGTVHALPQQPVQQVNNAPKTNTELLFCTNCGAKLNEDSEFCGQCGTSRQTTIIKYNKEKKYNKLKLSVRVIILSLIGVLFAGTGFLFLIGIIISIVKNDFSNISLFIILLCLFLTFVGIGSIYLVIRLIKDNKKINKIGNKVYDYSQTSDTTEKSEVYIQSYTNEGIISLKIKVFCNGRHIGIIEKGESIVVPISADSTIMFQCHFRKTSVDVKAGKRTELKLEFDTVSGKLCVFDLNSGESIKQLGNMRKRAKKWAKIFAVLAVIGWVFFRVIKLIMVINQHIPTEDDYINLVKNGHIYEYEQATVGEVLDDFLLNEEWEFGESEDGDKFVNVTGLLFYDGEETEALIQFFVYYKDDTFEFNALEIDDVPQTESVFKSLLKEAFAEYENPTTIPDETDVKNNSTTESQTTIESQAATESQTTVQSSEKASLEKIVWEELNGFWNAVTGNYNNYFIGFDVYNEEYVLYWGYYNSGAGGLEKLESIKALSENEYTLMCYSEEITDDVGTVLQEAGYISHKLKILSDGKIKFDDCDFVYSGADFDEAYNYYSGVSNNLTEDFVINLLAGDVIDINIYDYDNDGEDECFAVCSNSEPYDGWLYTDCVLYFITKDGAYFVTDQIGGYPRGILQLDEYKFFVWENSGGGSGSNTAVYTVKNGKPFEVNISRELMKFNIQNGVITGTTQDFSSGSHQYITNYYEFDKKTISFIWKNSDYQN